jgi:hypothetical protein
MPENMSAIELSSAVNAVLPLSVLRLFGIASDIGVAKCDFIIVTAQALRSIAEFTG